jgi:hypothetical protein
MRRNPGRATKRDAPAEPISTKRRKKAASSSDEEAPASFRFGEPEEVPSITPVLRIALKRLSIFDMLSLRLVCRAFHKELVNLDADATMYDDLIANTFGSKEKLCASISLSRVKRSTAKPKTMVQRLAQRGDYEERSENDKAEFMQMNPKKLIEFAMPFYRLFPFAYRWNKQDGTHELVRMQPFLAHQYSTCGDLAEHIANAIGRFVIVRVRVHAIADCNRDTLMVSFGVTVFKFKLTDELPANGVELEKSRKATSQFVLDGWESSEKRLYSFASTSSMIHVSVREHYSGADKHESYFKLKRWKWREYSYDKHGITTVVSITRAFCCDAKRSRRIRSCARKRKNKEEEFFFEFFSFSFLLE